jgi:formyl-CoA transferase
MLMSYANAGVRYPRIPDRHPAIAPYGVFRCADGADVLIAIEQNHEWRLLCRHVLHDQSLAEDERFATNSARIAHRETVDRLVEAAVANLTLPEATAMLDRLELAYGVVNDVAGVAGHAVTAARGMLADVASGNGNGATVKSLVGIGERMVGRTSERARPPRLGEDTDAVLRELGLSDPKGVVAS